MPAKKTTSQKSIGEETLALQIRAEELPVPERQYKFLADRKFAFDFAWPAHNGLALEVEGGIWRKGGGAHSHPTNILRDIEKHNLAVLAGWRVLRFTTDQVKSGEAVNLLKEVFAGLA